MSKANPQTIVSDRLLHMQENTNNLKRVQQKDQTKIDTVKQLVTISEHVKLNKCRQNQTQPEYQDALKERVCKRVQYPEWLGIKKQLLQYQQTKVKAKPTKRDQYVQNFQLIHKRLFVNAGISFGEDQASRINIAMNKLSIKANVKQIRFWGKILARYSDYYVIQGVSDKKNPEKVLEGMQKYGEGANSYSYWVNSISMGQQWHELPLITPEQLKTAKLIKYKFTGNLNSQIKCYPIFKGREQHFLKAQLVRITHNCEIAPKGMYEPNQQNSEIIQFTEQFKLPEFSELTNLENWVHKNTHLLELGRASYWTDPKLSQQQKQEQLNRLGEIDPKIDRLKEISEDKPVQKKGLQGSWFVRTIGSPQTFNNVGKDEGTTSCYATVSLKNVNWPGWISLSNMDMFDSIYIGYGIKSTQSAFFPLSPQDIMFQGQDIDENPEPNPRDPPDELQPDSDDENKPNDDQ